ncbi:MAG: DDE-type integrase/transposase/recombinase [Stellaceae bacterium]
MHGVVNDALATYFLDAAPAAAFMSRWLKRYRAGGEIALQDRSSTPGRYRRRAPSERDAAIERLRRQRMTGNRIAQRLGLPRSTVGAVLRRLGLGRLKALDPPAPVVRYERERPGELVHLDTKKLGRIDGVGHRITGHRARHHRARHHRARGIGWEVLHVCIDDASRLACTELLPDEKKEKRHRLSRPLARYARLGISVERVMTDNGSAYRSHDFSKRLKEAGIRHIRTRPCTPQTNGKAPSASSRPACANGPAPAPANPLPSGGHAMHPWIADYNHNRPHSALAGKPPAARLNNVLGFHS